MKKIAVVLIIVAIVLMVLSGFCVVKGFDYKDNYYQSENYPSLNRHAYVGGDAYNYIINGTYFTGFMVLAGASGLSGVILLCTGLQIRLKSKNKVMDGLQAIYKKIDEIAKATQKSDNKENREETV